MWDVVSRGSEDVGVLWDRGADIGQKDGWAKTLGKGLTGTKDWAGWFWWMGGL